MYMVAIYRRVILSWQLLFCRLAHDISPENYPDELNDTDSELRKEQFILSCLQDKSSSDKKRHSYIDCMKDVGHEKEGKVDLMSPQEIKQKTLEQLNNVINVQFHGTESKQKNQSDSSWVWSLL